METVARSYRRIREHNDPAIFIALRDEKEAMAEAENLSRQDAAGLPLLGTYRLWVTEQNVNRWNTREKQSNHPLDLTFVYGDVRVCYNAATLYSGSPWHTPGYSGPLGGSCDYELNLAKDDQVLGTDDFVLATIGNLNSEGSLQAEQAAFWILRKLGAPYLNRRHVRVFFNGQQRGNVYEDAQQPSRELVSQYFPDDDAGSLHKIEDWFEFDGKYFKVPRTQLTPKPAQSPHPPIWYGVSAKSSLRRAARRKSGATFVMPCPSGP